MSFDIYFKIMIDADDTQIFNNTELILSESGNQDMMLIGIDYQLNTTIADTDNNYLDLVLPCYTVKKQYQYDFKQNSGENNSTMKALAKTFKDNLMRLATDYAVIFINDFGDYPIDNYLFRELTNMTSLADDTSSGSWLLFLKNTTKTDLSGSRGQWCTMIDVIDTGNDIDKYHMTHSQIASLDKDTWNELFEDNSDDSYIQETYQQAFDDMDELIYSDSSNFVVILSKIHHHLIHHNRQLSSSSNTDAYNVVFVEEPYYDQSANSGELTVDKQQLRTDLKEFNRIAVAHGLPTLRELMLPIIRDAAKTKALITVKMTNAMLTARNYYITIRTEFYSKFDLTEES